MLFIPDGENVSVHFCYLTATLPNRRRRDYSGLPLLKAITSASDEGIYRFARLWIYSNEPQAGGDEFPFLLINGGAATLSGSTLGAAIVRDTITRREIQVLEHTGNHILHPPATLSYAHIRCSRSLHLCDGTLRSTQGRGYHTHHFLSAKAYHVSSSNYKIATVDRGTDAIIKVWTTQRPSSSPQDRVSGSFGRWGF